METIDIICRIQEVTANYKTAQERITKLTAERDRKGLTFMHAQFAEYGKALNKHYKRQEVAVQEYITLNAKMGLNVSIADIREGLCED